MAGLHKLWWCLVSLPWWKAKDVRTDFVTQQNFLDNGQVAYSNVARLAGAPTVVLMVVAGAVDRMEVFDSFRAIFSEKLPAIAAQFRVTLLNCRAKFPFSFRLGALYLLVRSKASLVEKLLVILTKVFGWRKLPLLVLVENPYPLWWQPITADFPFIGWFKQQSALSNNPFLESWELVSHCRPSHQMPKPMRAHRRDMPANVRGSVMLRCSLVGGGLN